MTRLRVDASSVPAQTARLTESTLAALRERSETGAITHSFATPLAALPFAQTPMLVVVGTGGASLGAQALCALAPQHYRVRFLENCDPYSVQQLLQQTPLVGTAWLFISKSGETVETLAATLAIVQHYQAAGQSGWLDAHSAVITTPQDSSLRRFALARGWHCHAHDAILGGRFSVFSEVGLWPAAWAGIDTGAIRASAQLAWSAAWKDARVHADAAWFAASLPHQPLHAVMAYGDRLRPYTQWYKQLWAESLGKDGKGATPLTAIGALDQHSQLQLYLEGPRDKCFTLLLPEFAAPLVPLAENTVAGMAYLGGQAISDVMRETAHATVTTMRQHGLPLRVVHSRWQPEDLAAWMARQMVECLLVATLMGVDPYSQPAVEEGKLLTRHALGGAV